MNHRLGVGLTALIGLLVMSACAAAAGSAAGGDPEATPTATATLATAGPTMSPSALPTVSVPATGPTEPAAILQTGDGPPISGTLGSWAFEDAGSDTPWIPSTAMTPLDVAAGRVLAVTFADAAPVGAWQAAAAHVADHSGRAAWVVGGRDTSEPSMRTVVVGPLPVGDWVLSVRLFRADGRGDAAFYWSVMVR